MGPAEKVFAWIDETAVIPGVYQDCPANIIWKYKDGKKYGSFDISYGKDLYVGSDYYSCDERMEITGSRGVLWVTRCTATMIPELAPVIVYKDGKTKEFWDMPTDWAESFKNCTRDFIDAIKNDREPKLSGERGREVLKFALATLDSSNKKCEIYLDSYEDRAPMKRKGFFGIFNKKK
jgi:predicted dehydrogenase